MHFEKSTILGILLFFGTVLEEVLVMLGDLLVDLA